ncbi:WG repeat-containing protein [bacterium]|nr:WG repeat-containing protein [bacterium]
MTLESLNISTETQDLANLVMNPFLENGLKQLIAEYHSNKVREIISENTDIFSVFHYSETKLINEIAGIGYWSVKDINNQKIAVINSNKEFVIPFGNYNSIEEAIDNKICCSIGPNKCLFYDYDGNLLAGDISEDIPKYREKLIAQNRYTELIIEEIKKLPLDINTEHIYRLKSQIKLYEENFEVVKNNTQKMEISPVKHSVFDYSKSVFSVSHNKRFFYLKDKNTQKYGLVNAKGELITPFIYDDIAGFVSGEGEYILMRMDNKYGLLDCVGQTAVKPISDNCISFYDGLAVIEQDKKFGYIDTSGNMVIPVIYDKAELFVFGKAEVEQNGEKFFINRKGERIKKC